MQIAQTRQNCPDLKITNNDWAVHNQGVTPEFFTETIKREDGTEFEREFVTYRIAGDDLTQSCQPVDAQIRERFADQYVAWKSGTDAAASGTPISQWPELNSRQASALEALNIFTVEDLAHLADGNIHNIHDGRALRYKAIAWLKRQAANFQAIANDENRARLDALEKGQAAPPIKGKPKRAPMSQAQRDSISATMKARWRSIPSTEAASTTDKSENPACGPEVLPPV